MLVRTSMRTGGTPSTMSVRGFVNFASVMLGAGAPKNERRHALARRAFAVVRSISMSMSFVARGLA
jgi:hypothetical protein